MSVRTLNARIVTKRNKLLPAHILTPYESLMHLDFATRKMVGGRHPFPPEILGQIDPLTRFKNGDSD